MDKKLAQPEISSIFKISQKKIAVFFALILLITMTISALHSTPVQATTQTVLYINPQKTQLSEANYPIGSTFTVQVIIANVTNMYGYQYQLNWNSSILNLAGVHDNVPLPHGYFLADNTTQYSSYGGIPGQMTFVVTSTSGSGVTGSFVIRTITFQTMIAPNPPQVNYLHTFMNFSNVILGDPAASQIPNLIINGEFYYLSPSTSYLMSQVSPPHVEWNRTYGWSDSFDILHSGIQTTDGGYALAGSTLHYGGNWMLWLVRTDQNGNMLWNKTYAYGIAYSVVQASDGGFVIAGTVGDQAYLVRTDSAGNQLVTYTETGGYTGKSGYYSIIKTIDGGYAVAGWERTGSILGNSLDFLASKFDSYPSKTWTQTYSGAGDDIARCIAQTTDGGYVLVGDSNDGSVSQDAWLVRTDSGGHRVWDQHHGGDSFDWFTSVVVLGNDLFLAGGQTWSYGPSIICPWLFECTTPDNPISHGRYWDTTYPYRQYGSGLDRVYSIVKADDGGYVIATDCRVAHVDSYGNTIWNESFGDCGTTGDGPGSTIIKDADGSYTFATSANYGDVTPYMKFRLIKLDLETLQMSPPIYGPTNPAPYNKLPLSSAPRQYESVKVQTMINGTRTGRTPDQAFLFYEVNSGPWTEAEMSYNATSHYWYGYVPGQDAYQNVSFYAGAVLGQSIIVGQSARYSVRYLVPGDVNGDFHVDVLDLILVATHLTH